MRPSPAFACGNAFVTLTAFFLFGGCGNGHLYAASAPETDPADSTPDTETVGPPDTWTASENDTDTEFTPEPPEGTHFEPIPELSDEFNEAKLDTDKWFDTHPSWAGRAPSEFVPGHCFVKDGMMQLQTTLRADPATVADPYVDIWIDAAACASTARAAMPGDFFEIRMKSATLSIRSSFWFKMSDFSEIVAVSLIGNPSVVDRQEDLPFEFYAFTNFYGDLAPEAKGAGWHMDKRVNEQMIRYGFWWKSPTLLIFYVNGQEVMTLVPNGALDEPLHMILSTEAVPTKTGDLPSVGLPLPENLLDETKNRTLIDYVRAYRLTPN